MRLIRGAAGTGKTALVFCEFKEALRAGRTDLRILAPTATLVRHLQHELARDGIVFSPACVTSLSRFARERAPDLKQVSGDLLRITIRELLRSLKPPEFAAVADTEGMVSTLLETIGLFENAGCTPDKLAGVRKSTPQAKAFEKIWRAVNESIHKRGYCTRVDVIRQAAANATPARIWMDGFLNFSPLEQELVRGLAQTCDLTIALTDTPATDALRRFALSLGAQDRLLTGTSRKPREIVIEARSVEREADELARRILLLHEQGTAFRNIGIALQDAETYGPLLRGTFERFGIPARFYFSNPLHSHPVAIFLGGLISGAIGNWDFESTIEALGMHPRWGRSAEFDRFDFAAREAMPGRGAEALVALCERDWLRDEISGCLKPGLRTGGPLQPAAWQQRFESFATSIYRPGILEIPRDYTGIDAARSHVAALHAWLEAVESAAAFFEPDQPVSLHEFWRIASETVSAANFNVPDDRHDVVQVMNAWEARQWDVSCLFVCGMTDRDFPKRHPCNLLFPDNEIDRLRGAGIPLRKASDREQEEHWLFHSLETRARQLLFLSYPLHDNSGVSVEKSRFIDRQAEPARLWRPLAATPDRPGINGFVQSSTLLSDMGELHRSISVTGLEDLAQCRFKFFSGRTLGLRASPERPRDRLNARITGSILHDALDRWQKDKGRDFVELFDQAFEEACRKDRLPPGYRLEIERIRFREIARLVSAREKWKPDSSDAEISLTLELPGGIAMSCRIDRIDQFGNDCVIVDYKSSKTANVEKLTTSTTRLQGPLYALAVRERLNLNPVAVVYWAVQEDEIYGWGKIPGYTGELLDMPDNWSAEARTRIADRITGFLAGDVRAQPEELANCRWCDFASACRFDQRQAARAASRTGQTQQSSTLVTVGAHSG